MPTVKLLIFPFSFFIVIISAFGQVTEVKEAANLCAKASGISQRFQERFSKQLNVSIYSIKFYKSDKYMGGCSVTVDTPRGLKTCTASSLMTDGKNYWIDAYPHSCD
jgi:hypothetical protein